MKQTLRQDGLIHRQAMSGSGRAQCGATAPDQGFLNLSAHGVGVTCPDCQPKQAPSVFCGISCPRCSDHGWWALTREEASNGLATCKQCGYVAPMRDFIYTSTGQ